MCNHEQFRVDADVTRILNGATEADGSELVAFACNLRVRCENCSASFAWRSVDCGVSVNGRPMRSADGLELRAWLVSPAELALLDPSVPAGIEAP